MIKSFRCEDAEALYGGGHPRRFRAFEKVAVRKLQQLDDAVDLRRDLGGIPGNRLERLIGDRSGQWSIRINDQWRLCFEWRDGHAYGVEIVDYH